MQPTFVAIVTVVGLMIGSFLNVVIYRVPGGQSVVSPPSACPHCGAKVRPMHNIPVLGWLLLRGECKDCGASISARYPAIEAFTGFVFGLLAFWQGMQWVLVPLLYLAAISIALAMIDLDVFRLPDAIVLNSYPVAAIGLLTEAFVGGHAAWWRIPVGGLIMFGLYWTIRFIKPKGMGAGDVKLAGVLGMYLGYFGWGSLAVGTFAGFLLGGLFGIFLMLFGGGSRKTKIPYGPYLIAGTWVGIIWGQQIWGWYLGLAAGG